MAEKTPSWIDYLNLGLTAIVGILGVYVAVTLGRSADQLGRNGLVVASATFLLDDSPQRQVAGVQIVSWLKENDVTLPSWEQDIVAKIASGSTVQAPSGSENPPAPSPQVAAPSIAGPVPPPQPRTAQQQTADQLFRSIGGSVPRLFIQTPDPEQQAGAELLRRMIAQWRVNGALVIVPGIEKVSRPPETLQLRFLKKADQAEAQALARMLDGALGQTVAVQDLSGTYEAKANVKPRTYELWFPHGQAITVKAEAG